MILTSARVNGVLNRFYVLPPGTPKERVNLLRKAFMDTMKDPEFLADTQKRSSISTRSTARRSRNKSRNFSSWSPRW